MHINNEIGSVQPIEEAAQIVKSYNHNILFHVDAVQGFGKYRIHPKRMGIDMLSISMHPDGLFHSHPPEGMSPDTLPLLNDASYLRLPDAQ